MPYSCNRKCIYCNGSELVAAISIIPKILEALLEEAIAPTA
ncbi:hypothetical protein [Scytonema sp. PCC 10023]